MAAESLLLRFMPAGVGLLETVRIDEPVLGFTFAVAVLRRASYTGLAPLRSALHASVSAWANPAAE